MTQTAGATAARPLKTPRRFECIRCQKHFSRLEHLQRHDRTHTRERPFSCDQCPSSFTRSDLLIRHGRLSHNKERRGAPSQIASPRPDAGSARTTRSERATRRVRAPSSTGQEEVEDSGGFTGVPLASPSHRSVRSPPHELGEDATRHAAFPPLFVDHTLPSTDGYRTPLETLSLAAAGHAGFQPPRSGLDQASSGPPAAAMLEEPAPTTEPADVAMPSSSADAPMYPFSLDNPPLFGNLDVSFDSFAAYLETEPPPLSSTQAPSYFLPTEQQGFSTDLFSTPGDAMYDPSGAAMRRTGLDNNAQTALEEQTSFSRFGSRLPSLQPEEDTDAAGQSSRAADPHSSHHQTVARRRVWDISTEDRQGMLRELATFRTVPQSFQLPTKMSLARYIRAYVNGFQEHLPFLHTQSMTVEDSAVELLLAMAAVGAQYCFEARRGVELFHAARAIATERIRRRDARAVFQRQQQPQQLQQQQQQRQQHYGEPDGYSTQSPLSAISSPMVPGHAAIGPLGLPSEAGSAAEANVRPREDLMQSAQALLILMAMATWAKHREILREALAIQSVLASIIRDDGLRMPELDQEDNTTNSTTTSWTEWIREESMLRTKYIVFCFFNLHSIVYDIPPLLLNAEIAMRLPCSTAAFRANSESRWREAMARSKVDTPPTQFQDALRWLFSRTSSDPTPHDGVQCHSALGSYILIHAINQHIFLVRQTARGRGDERELTDDEAAPLELALRRWQVNWNCSPESAMDPSDPNGPVAFNATALFRLAYIRLNVDTGPGRALGTRDPVQIARALSEMPAIKRAPKLVRALLHSAHALSIPVKIGVRLVSKTQSFIWSIQQSLCSLECAILLSKWLETVSVALRQPQPADPPISEDERKILSLVMAMLDETEFAVPREAPLVSSTTAKQLSAAVLRVWATVFCGPQTWAIVDVIGSSLHLYAAMLESS
ncbi:Zinc finger, C2H2-type/integrase, DNA-binding protein [Niveomyces insectorum RCEF 264]|uniref:Zinc finger, C2H2-type/integrase, DNA-binding protein n=1 Tax=Niveomyces insectorum RCEF 264 TaxID=1081102 RepID=A0A162IAX7_9HYPO|nr:Zinc finger, C2H2-type/integrase, DNA-binding protein [Niveomyces insectorum RCEF 264]